MELTHGCRAEYGALELRIEVTNSSSGFIVHVEDPALEPRSVYEQAIQGTLESAKEYAVLRAHEYLNSYTESAQREAEWRCS